MHTKNTVATSGREQFRSCRERLLILRRFLAFPFLLLILLGASSGSYASDGQWSGISKPVNTFMCPEIKQTFTATISNGWLNGVLQDGWGTEHKISGAIDGNGHFASNTITRWPHYQTRWTQIPTPSESQLVGMISGDTFQGFVYALNGRKSCDTVVYLLKGSDSHTENSIKEVIAKNDGEVLGFREMRFRFLESYQVPEGFVRTQEAPPLENVGTDTRDEISGEFDSVSEKLQTIKILLEEGLISSDEAARKRMEILEDF